MVDDAMFNSSPKYYQNSFVNNMGSTSDLMQGSVKASISDFKFLGEQDDGLFLSVNQMVMYCPQKDVG